jgi:hypothetical protein
MARKTQQSSRRISDALAEALGLESTSPGWAELREVLGIHQAPEHLIPILERYSDDLPAPRLPNWTSGDITSPFDLAFNQISDDDKTKVRELSDELYKRPIPPGWLRKLRTLQERYADVPLLFNLEVNYYRFNNNTERWRSSAEAVYERYPGYLFAACTLASYWLIRNQPEYVPGIFNEVFEIEDYAGERSFDASEVSAFYGTMAWFHLFNQRIVRAAICMSLIHAARPKDPFLDTLTSWLLLLPERAVYALAQTLRTARAAEE